MFGLGSVDSMTGPYLKKNGASDFDVALLFLEVGTTSILGSIFFAQVCTNKIYAIIITIKKINKGVKCKTLSTFYKSQLVDRCESKKSLSEKQNSAFKYALVGNIFWAIAMLFVGPVPFVKLVPNVGMTQVPFTKIRSHKS